MQISNNLDHSSSLLERVLRIKKIVEYSRSQNCAIIEPVDASVIERLAATDGFPEDMLLILKEIGSVRNWSYRDHMQIYWWIPCDYATAKRDERFYSDPDVLEKIENDLLFFANDCDAAAFFFDNSTSPWSVRALDTLSYCSDLFPSDPKPEKIYGWNENRDAISIIEDWANSIVEFQK